MKFYLPLCQCKVSSKLNVVRMAIKRKVTKVLSRKIVALGQIGFDRDGNMVFAPEQEVEDLANRYLNLFGMLTVEAILKAHHAKDLPLVRFICCLSLALLFLFKCSSFNTSFNKSISQTMDKKIKKVKERVVSIVAAKFEEDICDFDQIGFDENNELFIKPTEEEVSLATAKICRSSSLHAKIAEQQKNRLPKQNKLYKRPFCLTAKQKQKELPANAKRLEAKAEAFKLATMRVDQERMKPKKDQKTTGHVV